MARPSNTNARRRQIRHGLLQVMAEKGYERASIADVARAADLQAGLVHYHYKTKLKILLDLLERLDRTHQRRLDETIENAGPDPMRQLDAAIDLHLSTDESDPDALACWTALGGEALKNDEVQARFQAAIAAITQRLRPILEAAGFASPDSAAIAIVAAIQGYLTLGVTTRLVPPNTAATCVRQMARGLKEKS